MMYQYQGVPQISNLTKRELFAVIAMHALLASGRSDDIEELAVLNADDLIKVLNETYPEGEKP